MIFRYWESLILDIKCRNLAPLQKYELTCCTAHLKHTLHDFEHTFCTDCESIVSFPLSQRLSLAHCLHKLCLSIQLLPKENRLISITHLIKNLILRCGIANKEVSRVDHARLDLLSLVIWTRVFWPSLTWNLRKAQRWSKSFLTFDRCRPYSVTFSYC